MLIWAYAGGTHDPSLRRHGGRESLHRSSPTQVGRKVLGGDAVEAPEPFLQSAMVGVHVVDMIFRRFRLRIARRGQNVDIEFGAPRERCDGRSAIAAKVRRRGHDPAERRCQTDCVEPRQDRVECGAGSVARDDDGDLFLRQAAFVGLASSFARGSRETFMLALERFQNECLVRLDYSR